MKVMLIDTKGWEKTIMINNKVRSVLLVLGLLVLSLTVAASSIQQDKETPEMKAIREMLDLTDPQQQIDAMVKFLTDYPDSVVSDRLTLMYLELLFETWPNQKDKILLYANKLIEVTPERYKSAIYNDVADKLLNAGILLDKAEEFADKGLKLIDKQLAEDARVKRAVNLSTLGEVYFKQGKVVEAKKLLKEAYDAQPTLRAAPIVLAKIESDEGNHTAAVNYLVPIAITGRMTQEARQILESSYRKTHNGSLEGLDAMLDAEYEKRFPKPIKEVEPYKAAQPRGDRVVLAEVFSSASCPPCAAADLAFDAIMKRYSREDLVVVMYHLDIPRRDPMTSPSAETRADFYKAESTPIFLLDGRTAQEGGGTRDEAVTYYQDMIPKIDERFKITARVKMRLDVAPQGSTIKVKATIDQVKSTSPNLKLQIALVEDELRYLGESGIRLHPMVVRSLAGPAFGGFDLDPSKPTTIEYSFDLAKINSELNTYLEDKQKKDKFTFQDKKLPINPGKLSVVAFVQDTKTKIILQSAYVKVKP